ncbi:MAG TPA: hypothetical protein VMT55_05415, partial [Candidatus Sulfotelmatobacter sp.]|nr:hypothetical protein [Candidatus Sulfotelmatobacter sp.]
MPKIEKLTAEQIAKFPEYVERWTKIGLSTEPADRPRAEAAIHKIYKTGGLPSPKTIVWCSSPLVAVLAINCLRNFTDEKIKKLIGTKVNKDASVSASVSDSVRASVLASVLASVRDSVSASVRASVSDSVRASVLASVSDSVRASVSDSVRASV